MTTAYGCDSRPSRPMFTTVFDAPAARSPSFAVSPGFSGTGEPDGAAEPDAAADGAATDGAARAHRGAVTRGEARRHRVGDAGRDDADRHRGLAVAEVGQDRPARDAAVV